MKQIIIVAVCLLTFGKISAQETKQASVVSPERIVEFIHWYPAIEQAKMRDDWLAKYKQGEWQFTGMVTAKDRTVITPQADVNYGYSWFNISNQPVVVTMPEYDKYYSLSVFDMNHFMEVYVMPGKPVVIRLPHQKSPVKDAIEIVLHTYWGLAFTRQVIVDNEEVVMNLAKKITITGGGGYFPFIVPDFTKEEQEAGMKIIRGYSMKIKNGRKLFGSPYEGVGDMDCAAGVFLGQLGTQARYVDYAQDVVDQNGEKLNGTDSYQITVPKESLSRNNKGYWSYTIYNMEDRYLIPNPQNKYVISSYQAEKNANGTVTININPEGKGKNALPTNGKPFYGIFRVYEPVNGVVFPKIKKVK
jgi:hypothetical protein